MKKRIKKVILFFCVVFIIHVVIIVADGLSDDKGKAQVAVILGSKVNKDGSLSDRLKARLDKGLALYKNNTVQELYVSGGLGIEGHYEGTVMAEYLITKGVPKHLIKIDNEGVNTRGTAVNFVRDYSTDISAIVVTQYFHVTRCKFAFKQVGVQDVKGAHCDFFETRDPYSILREFAGFYKYLLWY